MSTRILLVARHGQATQGPDHVWTPDDPLTELGHRQASDLAAHVAGLRRPPTRIVASPFLRAQQTAAPSAEALALPIETDPRLAEFASTLPSPWTLAESDELRPYDDIWHPGDAGWDGETIGSFFERTGAAAEDHARADDVALLVCHGGTTMGIIRWALMIPPREPDAFDLFIANASLTEIRTRIDRHGRERRHIRRVADVRYLGEVTGI
jgi:alpha-ribazole phosphatase